MTQALNFTTQALESLSGLALRAPRFSKIGLRYICSKLEQAQAFIVPDYGHLLDRAKPRPEVPGVTFRPAFPVMALEYCAPPEKGWSVPGFTDTAASKRIALAWQWEDDLPPELRRAAPDVDGVKEEGVVVASLFYADQYRSWVMGGAAAHFAFDAEWVAPPPSQTIFAQASIDVGRITPAVARANRLPFSLLPLAPEWLMQTARLRGNAMAVEAATADLMDEVNAYMDLCYALSCNNVGTELIRQPEALNKKRISRGDKPLKDFHILKLTGADHSGGEGAGVAGARRAHMRRGHIRQLRYLGEGRMTWVNATMVKGKGFVDKAYAL